MRRRSFLQLSAAALPAAMFAQTANEPAKGASALKHAVRVQAGEDRTGTMHGIGVSKTAYKVLTADSGGELFLFQHENHVKGGPPRHMHHVEDEFFYVLEGKYVFEVGTERMELKAGDCILAPKLVPHVWAYVGDGVGRILVAFTPAGDMEAFFNEPRKPGDYNYDVEIHRKHNLELMGPPLKV